MSIISALLGWTGLPTWLTELLAILIILGGAGIWWKIHDHRLIQEGVAKEIAIETQESARIQRAADLQTQINLTRAKQAEAARDASEQALTQYRASHPDLNLSELCKPSGSSAGVRQGRPRLAGNVEPSPAAGVVQPLPQADRGQPDDRRLLLEALAGMADSTSNTLREYQAR